MAFRRRFPRRVLRRRRRSPETYTIVLCRQTSNVYETTTCSDADTHSFQILGPIQETSSLDPTTARAVVETKSHTLKGLKFQAEWSTNPDDWLGNTCDPDPFNITFNLTIWEAIVYLPLQQGSKTLPLYIPNLTGPAQSFDLADRVLWKRLSMLPMWGAGVTGGVPQLEFTARDTAAGPQVVRAKARMDDRHALFYVWQFVHNVVLQSDPVNCVIPVTLDFWAKVFYNTNIA